MMPGSCSKCMLSTHDYVHTVSSRQVSQAVALQKVSEVVSMAGRCAGYLCADERC